MGVSPTRQRSLQPVAIGAAVAATKPLKSLVQRPRKEVGEHPGRNLSERCARLENTNVQADLLGLQGRLPSSGRQERRGPDGWTGVVAMAWMRRRPHATREAPSVVARDHQRMAREGPSPAGLGGGEVRSTVEAG